MVDVYVDDVLVLNCWLPDLKAGQPAVAVRDGRAAVSKIEYFTAVR